MPNPVPRSCCHHWLVASIPTPQARDRTSSQAQARDRTPSQQTEMAYDASCRACGAARRFPALDDWFEFNDSLPSLETHLRDDLAEPTPQEAAAWAEGLEICLRAG